MQNAGNIRRYYKKATRVFERKKGKLKREISE